MKSFKIIIILTLVAGISGFILSYFSSISEQKIIEQNLKMIKEGIFSILNDSVDYKEITVNGSKLYQGIDNTGNSTGYAFIAEGTGFQGKIKLLVGVNNDFSQIKGIEVLDSVETPGLGGKITEEKFLKQFEKLNIPPVETITDANLPIQTITGATISSKAVISIIVNELKCLKGKISERTT